jgi:hypothetical protein
VQYLWRKQPPNFRLSLKASLSEKTIAMLLESQYSQFKEGLNVTKPKGGISFITDFDRKDILAITHQANEAK